jgi:hypothetical protein
MFGIKRLLAFLLLGCDKDENVDNLTLLGKWIYNEDYSKTFDFQNSTDVLINGQEFLYKIESDSIEFSYNNGDLYIPIKHSKQDLKNYLARTT